MSAAPALSLVGIDKRFGSTEALSQARLDVRPGTVHALLGENGAGKTTLMRIAFGLIRPDRGTLLIDGAPAAVHSPADAIARRLGMVHQHFTLVPAMTVAENVALGGAGRYDARRARERVRAVAQDMQLDVDPDRVAASLGIAEQQRVEIVKALARDARTLILDEPTAVLAPADASALLDWLRRFADRTDAEGRPGTVILITHKLREALAIADEITVLRRGRTVLATAASATNEPALVAAMLGERSAVRQRDAAAGPSAAPPAPLPDAAPAARQPVLRAHDITVADERGVVRVRGVSLAVHAGEILGVAGVDGSGPRELLRALAGRLPVVAGRIERPAEIGFVPEDRQREALILDLTLAENLALHGAGARQGLIDWPGVARRTAGAIDGFEIRGAGPSSPAHALSGGNQQRFVLARELEQRPPAIVAENPTRGLDIRASESVRDRLRAARGGGAAIVIHSSDLDEVLALADRVFVMHDGRGREVPAEREAVGRAMLGVAG